MTRTLVTDNALGATEVVAAFKRQTNFHENFSGPRAMSSFQLYQGLFPELDE